jgi:hypothetical protein
MSSGSTRHLTAHHFTPRHNTALHRTPRHGTTQHYTSPHDTARHDSSPLKRLAIKAHCATLAKWRMKFDRPQKSIGIHDSDAGCAKYVSRTER